MATVTHTFVSGIADDPTAAAAGEVLPSHWNAVHTVSGVRTILTANTNYYVAIGGSDSNDGSLAHPWATLQHAMNVISQTLDIATFTVIINIGAGTFIGVGLKQIVGDGIVQWNGAGSGLTTVQDGPNDGVFNQGEAFGSYVPTLSTTHGINKLNMISASNFMLSTFAICRLILGDAPTVAGADVSYQFTISPVGAINFTNFCDVTFAPGNHKFVYAPANGTVGGASFFVGTGANINFAGAFTMTGNPNFTGNSFIQGFDSCFIDMTSSSPTFSGTAAGGPAFSLLLGSHVLIDQGGLGSDPPFSGMTLGTGDAVSSFNTLPLSNSLPLFSATPFTVSSLYPATLGAGMFAYVSDASSPVLGKIVVGSGGTPALVYSNGTNWIVLGVVGNGGINATITTAKLTPGGANGSMTFVNGLLTAQTPAT